MSEIYYTENIRLGCWTGNQFPPYLTEQLSHNFETIDRHAGNMYAEIDEVRDDIGRIVSTANIWAAGVTARLSAIDKMNLEQNESIERNKDGIHSNKVEIESLDDRLTTVEEDISRLTPPNLDSLEKRITMAEGNITLNSETLRGFSERLTDDEENIKMQAYRLANLERNLGSDGNRLRVLDQLNEKVNDQAAEIGLIKGRLNAGETAYETIKKEVEGLQENETVQNQTLITLSGSVTNLLQRMDYTERKIIEIESRLPPYTFKSSPVI